MAVSAFSTPELIHVVSLGLAGKSMCRLMALARSLARAQQDGAGCDAVSGVWGCHCDLFQVLDHRDWQGRCSSDWGGVHRLALDKALEAWAGADGWLFDEAEDPVGPVRRLLATVCPVLTVSSRR